MAESNGSNASYFAVFFIILITTLICFTVASQNMGDNPQPTVKTSRAPILSLRCRNNLFFIENSETGQSRPLMDVDAHGKEIQVVCTPAYEAQRSRRMMGYQ